MKSKDSSGKNKALKIFSNEYDSKLNRSIHAPLTDGSLASNISKKKEKECFFVDIFLNTKTTLIDQLHNVFCP